MSDYINSKPKFIMGSELIFEATIIASEQAVFAYRMEKENLYCYEVQDFIDGIKYKLEKYGIDYSVETIDEAIDYSVVCQFKHKGESLIEDYHYEQGKKMGKMFG